MKIHFVYAGSPDNGANMAPYTITRNLYNFLASKGIEVVYYDWCHTSEVTPPEPNDIILGHPNYPDNTATRQLFRYRCRARCLIFPFHHAMPWINSPFDDLVRSADRVFSIAGPYWYDTMDQTIFAHWKPKVVRVDMAVDAAAFPHLKKSFNPPGQRSFAYIGCDRPEKGLDLLYEIMRRSPYHLHAYGNIDGNCSLLHLKNVHYHGWADTNPAWANDFCGLVDCFLNASRSDANPTTLLESMSWGIPVACSRGSGYDAWKDGTFFGLNTDDPEGCANLLEHVNHMSDDDLKRRSAIGREAVETRYTWDKFCTTVWDGLKEYMW